MFSLRNIKIILIYEFVTQMARYIDQSFMLRKLARLQKMNPFEGCSHNHSGSEGDQEQKMGLGK